MKIITKENEYVRFDEVDAGTLFRYSLEEDIYLKIAGSGDDEYNCVDTIYWNFHNISDHQLIIVVEGAFVEGHK